MSKETNIFVFTGAGISADSGIDTFRGNNGLWNNYNISEICNYNNWEENAQKIHSFYSKQRQHLFQRDCNGNRIIKPNAMHRIIDGWQKDFNATVLTQNIDDLHECAGSKVTHLHGFLDQMECVQCGFKWGVNGEKTIYKETLCPRCLSERIKPGVIFFNEGAPEYKKLYGVLNTFTDNDIIIVTGCSCNVIPFDLFLRNRPGIKIWCNIDRYIEGEGESVFDNQMIGKANDIAHDLDYLVREKIK